MVSASHEQARSVSKVAVCGGGAIDAAVCGGGVWRLQALAFSAPCAA